MRLLNLHSCIDMVIAVPFLQRRGGKSWQGCGLKDVTLLLEESVQPYNGMVDWLGHVLRFTGEAHHCTCVIVENTSYSLPWSCSCYSIAPDAIYSNTLCSLHLFRMVAI